MLENLEKAKIVSETLNKEPFKTELSDQSKTVAVMDTMLGSDPIKLIMGLSNSEQTKKAETQPILTQTVNYNKIQTVIANMLTEGTGINMLDSGGVYGRGWQRNRMVTDFRENRPIGINLNKYNTKRYPDELDLYFSVDVFHFLTECLEVTDESERLDSQFNEFANLEENKKSGWYSLLSEWLEKHFGRCFGENTYNRESSLSQVLQYSIFDYDGENFIALQIHNGCDVRGGYTKPKILSLSGWNEYLPNDNDFNAYCGCATYYTDDSYHWYKDKNEHKSKIWKRGLPKKWRLVKTTQHGNDLGYVDDVMLKCNQCHKIVNFSSSSV